MDSQTKIFTSSLKPLKPHFFTHALLLVVFIIPGFSITLASFIAHFIHAMFLSLSSMVFGGLQSFVNGLYYLSKVFNASKLHQGRQCL